MSEKEVALLTEIRDSLQAVCALLRRQLEGGGGPYPVSNCSHGDYTFAANGSRVCRKCGQ